MARVDDIAAAVLARTGPLTSMKLQKLVYYVQAWHLAAHDEPAFDEPVQAWSNGPVVRRLFDQHRGLRRIAAWPSGDARALPARVARTVQRVVRVYGSLTAEQLSKLSHREFPWRSARRGLDESAPSAEVIERSVMADFYLRHAGGSAEEMVRYAIASGRLEGADEPTAAERERLIAVAEGRVDAKDAIAEVLAAYR